MPIQFLSNQEEFNDHIRKMKTLLLDFDGTLVDYYDNEANALGAILREHNIEEDSHQEIILQYRKINEKLWKLYEKKEATVEEVRIRRFDELNKIYSIGIDPTLFNDKYLENFSKFVKPFPGIIEKLDDFKEKHNEVNLIILTNGFNSTQIKRRTNSGLLSVTHEMISSDQAGIAKPSPKIFEFTEKHLNIKLSDSIMVGDSLSSDIQGAKNVGIPNVLIKPGFSHLSVNHIMEMNPKPDVIVDDCVELLEYIDNIRRR